MNKIPVGETIARSYGFAFGEFFSVLGIAWLPHLVFVAFVAAVVFGLTPELPGQVMRGEFNATMIDEITRIAGLLWLASIVTQCMVTVGLQKKALGRLEGLPYFYFSLGAPVWRMLAAYILAILSFVLIVLLTGILGSIAGWAAATMVPQYGKALAVVIGIACVFWVIYSAVRLFFFLPAVVVAEESIGIVRSWELGGGNFWRIVAVCFVVFVPVAIGFSILQNALVGPLMLVHSDMQIHTMTTPEDFRRQWPVIVHAAIQAVEQMRYAIGAVILLQIAHSIIRLGLANGAVAKAYLEVTGEAGAA
jgi:hypothetical protein